MKSTLEFEILFYEGLLKKNPNYVDALIPLAEAYTQKGLFAKGLEVDQKLSRIFKEDPTVHYNLACSLALMEKKKEALAVLQKAIRLGYNDFEHLKKDPDLKSLKADPAFQNLLRSFSENK